MKALIKKNKKQLQDKTTANGKGDFNVNQLEDDNGANDTSETKAKYGKKNKKRQTRGSQEKQLDSEDEEEEDDDDSDAADASSDTQKKFNPFENLRKNIVDKVRNFDEAHHRQ